MLEPKTLEPWAISDTEQFPGGEEKWIIKKWGVEVQSASDQLPDFGRAASPCSTCHCGCILQLRLGTNSDQRTTSSLPFKEWPWNGLWNRCPFGSQERLLSASASGSIFTENTTIPLAFECFWVQLRALCNEMFLCPGIVPVSWYEPEYFQSVQWALASSCRIFFGGLLIPISAATWARTWINQQKCQKTQTKGFLHISFALTGACCISRRDSLQKIPPLSSAKITILCLKSKGLPAKIVGID